MQRVRGSRGFIRIGVIAGAAIALSACTSTFNLAQREQQCGAETETFRAFGDCMKTAVAGPSQAPKPGSREERFTRMVDIAVARYEAGLVDLDAAMREYVDGRAKLQAEEEKANDAVSSAMMDRLFSGGGGSQPNQNSAHAVAAAILSDRDSGTYGSPGSLGATVDRTFEGFTVEEFGRLPNNVREFGMGYVMNTREGQIRFKPFMDSVTIEYPDGTSERCTILASYLNCN